MLEKEKRTEHTHIHFGVFVRTVIIWLHEASHALASECPISFVQGSSEIAMWRGLTSLLPILGHIRFRKDQKRYSELIGEKRAL